MTVMIILQIDFIMTLKRGKVENALLQNIFFSCATTTTLLQLL